MAVTLGSNISARWLRSYFSTLQSAHNLEGVAGFDSQASLVYWVGGNSHSHDVRPAGPLVLCYRDTISLPYSLTQWWLCSKSRV